VQTHAGKVSVKPLGRLAGSKDRALAFPTDKSKFAFFANTKTVTEHGDRFIF